MEKQKLCNHRFNWKFPYIPCLFVPKKIRVGVTEVDPLLILQLFVVLLIQAHPTSQQTCPKLAVVILLACYTMCVSVGTAKPLKR
eukprot:1138083-Amphidinium_carterae.1